MHLSVIAEDTARGGILNQGRSEQKRATGGHIGVDADDLMKTIPGADARFRRWSLHHSLSIPPRFRQVRP